MSDIHDECSEKMEKVVASLKRDLGKIRTGRANPSILDGLTIEYYGCPTPLKQLAQVSTPDARSLMISPFDKTCLPTIEKAINASSLGLPPNNDGQVIRLNIPELTEDRRKDLIKDMRKKGEDSKIVIRNIRRDGNDVIKKSEKAKEMSEDSAKDEMAEIQTLTDSFIAKVDEVMKNKEEDILTI
jgi:ribosome recycling factor